MPTVPPARLYAAALGEPGVSGAQRRMLRAHYGAPGRTATAGDLARAVGYRSHSPVNAAYGRLGRALCDRLGYRPEGIGLGVLVEFEHRGGQWHWTLRPEVAGALELLGWAGDPDGGDPLVRRRALGGPERRAAAEAAAEAAVLGSDAAPTEKDALVRARRGQGVFRRRVEALEPACRLTGTRDRSLLVASHIKPWRDASDAERVDGHNGLLLAPHVDALFDAGLLSFADDGAVLVASPGVREEMVRWGLDPDAEVGPFTARQRAYLAHHRSEVFGGRTTPDRTP